MKDIEEVISRASQSSIESSLEILDSFKEELSSIRGGHSETLEASGGLVRIDGGKPVVVVGDIHGDLESFRRIITSKHVVEVLEKGYLIFLGDYVDRGIYSPEVYLGVAILTLSFRGRVVVLRGNHEPPPGLTPYPHDLPYHLAMRYGEGGRRVYEKMYETFQILFHSCLWGEKAFLVHGGVPTEVQNLEEVEEADARYPKSRVLEELLWNDPMEGFDGWMPSHRGAGRLFGRNVTEHFLREVCGGVKVVVRGHEPCEGFKINHDGLVLTLFSRGGPPYFNSKASYLALGVSDFKNAYDMVEYGLVSFEV